MFTIINRRRVSDRGQETLERAQREFFPKLQSAPGFVGFYLVYDEQSGVNTAVIVWENQEQAQAFLPEAQQWGHVLDELGNEEVSTEMGETVVTLEAHRQGAGS